MSDNSPETLAPPHKANHESDDPPFAELNLTTFALAMIARLVFGGRDVKPTTHEQQFLQDYYLKIHSTDHWAQQLKRYLWTPALEDLALLTLANKLSLDNVELLIAALAIAVEEHPMVGRAIAYLQAPVGGSRPSLGLLETAFSQLSDENQPSWIVGTILSGAAVKTGLLQLINENAPIPEQSIRMPSSLALALRNKPFVWKDAMDYRDINTLTLPDSIALHAQRHAYALVGSNSTLVIRSASKREAQAVAFSIVNTLNKQAIYLQSDQGVKQGLGPLCIVKNLLPVFMTDVGPNDQHVLPEIPGYKGPVIVITGPDGNIDTNHGSILNWYIPRPTQPERQKLWGQYLGEQSLATELARNHVHSTARIIELSELALREAKLNQREQPSIEDVQQAAWSAEDGNLGSLAQPLTTRIPDDALVLPRKTYEELSQLLLRCKQRESLADNLGITVRTRYQMGVRCLLVGPSGTGKTLAASWLATHLGLPLYRVDLASVVSKYIGETEKNLATLLAKAEQSEIVLLFDEADSLFGKRTEIKDANDRYANSQTNYLLQRIEFYSGIVLLTSNSRVRFDTAFTRRLDKTIEFPLPGPEERRSLWRTHLGDFHTLTQKELNQLAVSSDLAGGHIKNAVLAAAVLAQSEQRKIGLRDIATGLDSEYRKLGRQMPADLKRI